jgi:deoxyribonuclease V
MRFSNIHDWEIDYRQAVNLQKDLQSRVVTVGDLKEVKLVAGVDVSVALDNQATAAVVVLDYPELQVVARQVVKGYPQFPYIPGLLSFREIPLLLQAIRELTVTPDLFLVDGQGIAHPRRCGLASHLGLFLDIPTIGCAKSRLIGEYTEPASKRSAYSPLRDPLNQDVIGVVLRTKDNTKPLFISVGHKIGLPSAMDWVLKCGKGYRLPEPTRLAHLSSRGQY